MISGLIWLISFRADGLWLPRMWAQSSPTSVWIISIPVPVWVRGRNRAIWPTSWTSQLRMISLRLTRLVRTTRVPGPSLCIFRRTVRAISVLLPDGTRCTVNWVTRWRTALVLISLSMRWTARLRSRNPSGSVSIPDRMTRWGVISILSVTPIVRYAWGFVLTRRRKDSVLSGIVSPSPPVRSRL